jgi:hypothetical protein
MFLQYFTDRKFCIYIEGTRATTSREPEAAAFICTAANYVARMRISEVASLYSPSPSEITPSSTCDVRGFGVLTV